MYFMTTKRDTVCVRGGFIKNLKRLTLAITGKLARIGTNMLITCDIYLVIHMNAPRSMYKRPECYLRFRLAPGIDNVGPLRDEKLT